MLSAFAARSPAFRGTPPCSHARTRAGHTGWSRGRGGTRAGERCLRRTMSVGKRSGARANETKEAAMAKIARGDGKAERTAGDGGSGKDAAARAPRAGFGLTGAESGIAKLWLATAGEQLRHHVETFGRLATARDWRDAAEIQKSYLRASLSRAARLAEAQYDLATAPARRMLGGGREGAGKGA